MNDVATPPSVADELDRKAFEAVDYLVRRHTMGAITDDAFSAGLQAVWGCASGLITEGTQSIVVEALKTVRKPRRTQLRAFRDTVSGQLTCVLSWTPGEDFCQVLSANGKVGQIACSSPAAAREAFRKACSQFEAAFQEFGA